MHFYASQAPGNGTPLSARVAVHGHPRDANTTFNAALQAMQRGSTSDRILVVAPVFQVGRTDAAKCHTAEVPDAQAGDLLWICASWAAGGAARNANGLTSFAALDALVAGLHQQWPSLQTLTIAGFSAGAQIVLRYIGFSVVPPASVALHFVVADPWHLAVL